MLKVFSDMHHASLYNSLIMLFEGRLGGEVFRPIGMEWWDLGYWHIYDHPDTARQYLSLDQVYKPTDGTPPLNQIIESEEGIYLCHDVESEKSNKAISFEKFKEMKFDILIASIPAHIEPFKKLISLYQPQAKLIYQVGNQWNIDSSSVRNVMASANVEIPSGINGIIYHQEFPLDIFTPCGKCFIKEYHMNWFNHSGKKIYSFINCLGNTDLYKKDWELFLELEKLMPDWEFKVFGGQNRDGAIWDRRELASTMQEATFIYQVKSEGDGFGHNIFSAAAMGKPLITRLSDYKGKLAEPLIIDRHSAITVDNKTLEHIKYDIELGYNQYRDEYSHNIYEIFKQTVDFDKEEQQIRNFLDNLQ